MKYCYLIFILLLLYVTFILSTLLNEDIRSYTITPVGLRHKSCVHKVPPRAKVLKLDDGSERFFIQHNNIDTIIEPCKFTSDIEEKDYIAYNNNNNKSYDNDNDVMANGWVAYAYSEVNENFTLFISNTIVPPHPDSFDTTSLLFYFIGLLDQPYNKRTSQFQILQPVLQWGESECGGGAYWAIGAWSILNNNVFCSDISQVDEGDEIYMVINQTSAINPDEWTVSALSSKGTLASLNAFPTDTSFCYASVTLETFFVSNCMDFPDNTTGTILFDGILLSGDYLIHNPNWNSTIDTRGLNCNESVEIVDTTAIIIGF